MWRVLCVHVACVMNVHVACVMNVHVLCLCVLAPSTVYSTTDNNVPVRAGWRMACLLAKSNIHATLIYDSAVAYHMGEFVVVDDDDDDDIAESS